MNYDTIRSEIRGSATEDVLLAVHAAGGEAHLSAIESAVGLSHRDVVGLGQRLRALGLVSCEGSMAGELTLTHDGRTLAERTLQSRTSGPERWDAVQRKIAAALTSERSTWHVEEVDGVAVSDVETRLAVHKLEQWGLVKATRNGSGEIYVVFPLDSIHQVPGIDGLLVDHFEGRVMFNDHSNTTNIGDGNTLAAVQTGGHGNTQNVTQSVTVEQRAQVLGLVGGLLRTLDEAEGDTSELRAAVEAIRDEAADNAATQQSLKDRVVQALLTAGASEAGQLIAHGLAGLLRAVAA